MRLVSDEAIAIATIFQEAEGESLEGKIAVGEVIRNRMKRKYFSQGDVVSTCLWPAQFSGWNTNSKNRLRSLRVDSSNAVVNDCAIAWEQSRESNLTLGAVLYLNPDLVHPLPSWASPSKQLASIGNHRFFAG